MSKAKRLLDILVFVSAKKKFTAQEVADEFNISIRTVHRYILDLSDMGLPIYAEQGRNGGYTVLSSRLLPPILFTEDEAVSIFFAFQSLHYYRDLPFNTEIKSVSQKLYSSLQEEAKQKVDKLQSYIAFWNPKRAIETPLLKAVLEAAIENKNLHIHYESKSGTTTKHIHPIGAYAHDGLWYMPAFDFTKQKILLFRVDRIISIIESEENQEVFVNLQEWFSSEYELKQPIHLNVLLSREGVRQCKSDPNLEDLVTIKEDGTGFIDAIIDKGELNFISSIFYRLGMHAQIVEPKELINIIRQQAKGILSMYPEND
ncbi:MULTISPECIES: YafY family protein [unclassified Lysinibacillus]|uniref:helix-turn-helix transcriptional regulator n=1 Tax=unclassified Lysinibacillus TaxID=2636778 RepID=UPI0020133E3A|nr:YafY family protein [Lysinibacillus sp. BPa_S21]MCL1696934.1 YafY family transcriptional regulator [Lysinibacillus sp. BPa_S21]MCL1701660.1 YafY family transcriptional regulator [Lysinibacillus sp. Bpr_S20]